MQTISLHASESNWRLFMIRKADPAFRDFEAKVFRRDGYCCHFCGFCSQDLLEVINLDQNYSNNRLSNLVTACGFCAQGNFLESLGKSDFSGGTLICLPEMSQADLNALCHVLFASLLGLGGGSSSQSRNFYRSLRIRAQMVEEQLGEGMSNPALLGQLLISVDQSQQADLMQELAQKIRLLPNLVRSGNQLVTLANNALNAMTYK
ncbi:MAG: type IVB secretion system protein IcmJDotN [Gammaproteobacteria bacterium]|nr:type IVB secretion system protein IcmJDotN [Gammaproteobacteria bacterium]